MKLVRMKVRLAALALAGITAMPAVAQTGAFATVNFSHYELVDLDLSDGVTPWLSFTGAIGLTSDVMILSGTSSSGTPVAHSNSWSGNLVELHADGYDAWAQAASDELSSFATGGPNRVLSTTVMRRDFLLSPNTGVTFFFYTALDTRAGENANFAATGAKVTFGNEIIPTTEIDAWNGEEFSGYLSTSRDVYGADAVQGRLWVGTYTESYAAAAPVPEPAAPAMLLGGLGLLAALGRRRAR